MMIAIAKLAACPILSANPPDAIFQTFPLTLLICARCYDSFEKGNYLFFLSALVSSHTLLSLENKHNISKTHTHYNSRFQSQVHKKLTLTTMVKHHWNWLLYFAALDPSRGS